MKLLSTLAIANSILAAASVLLGVAPFTGAPMAFIFWLPLAALFARKDQTIVALSVPLFAIFAMLLSPIRLDHTGIYFFIAWIIWVGAWSLVILYISRKKLRVFVTTIRNSGTF